MQVAKTINSIGIQEIHDFLSARHKLGGDHFTPAMINAWAEGAEFQLGIGSPATIEIKSWDSVSGHTETFTISDAGIDTEHEDIDE